MKLRMQIDNFRVLHFAMYNNYFDILFLKIHLTFIHSKEYALQNHTQLFQVNGVFY